MIVGADGKGILLDPRAEKIEGAGCRGQAPVRVGHRRDRGVGIVVGSKGQLAAAEQRHPADLGRPRRNRDSRGSVVPIKLNRQ
jgi:hypothetical protein